jgi:hypothetical protein
MNGVVLGGFGGICDFFNYTGLIVGVSTTPGVGVTQIYAMEGGPGAKPESDDLTTGNGGRAGIWQGGMGFSTDGSSRIFLVTGKNLHSFPLCDRTYNPPMATIWARESSARYRLYQLTAPGIRTCLSTEPRR